MMILIRGNAAFISAAAAIPSFLPRVHTSIKIRSMGFLAQKDSASPASEMVPERA